MKPCNTKTNIGTFRRLACMWLFLPVIFLSAPMLSAQNSAAPNSELKFEVLDVTTGSGSKSQAADGGTAILDAVPMAPEGAGEAPERTVASPSAEPIAAPTVPAPANGLEPPLPPQAQSDRTEDPKTGKEQTEEEKAQTDQLRLITALDSWHYLTLQNYNYNILSLADPFMPIKEVRGRQEEVEEIDPAIEATLPMILRLELNQLKLVAITILSNRPGGALASFEDGVGSSYILRQGDRIGRRKGVITAITATAVTVEEPPRSPEGESTITEMKLNTLSTDGLMRSGVSRNP